MVEVLKGWLGLHIVWVCKKSLIVDTDMDNETHQHGEISTGIHKIT